MQVYSGAINKWYYCDTIRNFRSQLEKIRVDVFKFCPGELEKHLKIIMAPFFLQQQFILYLHLDVFGDFMYERAYSPILVLFTKKQKNSCDSVPLREKSRVDHFWKLRVNKLSHLVTFWPPLKWMKHEVEKCICNSHIFHLTLRGLRKKRDCL